MPKFNECRGSHIFMRLLAYSGWQRFDSLGPNTKDWPLPQKPDNDSRPGISAQQISIWFDHWLIGCHSNHQRWQNLISPSSLNFPAVNVWWKYHNMLSPSRNLSSKERCVMYNIWQHLRILLFILLFLSNSAFYWFRAIGSGTKFFRNACSKLSEWLFSRPCSCLPPKISLDSSFVGSSQTHLISRNAKLEPTQLSSSNLA